VDLGGCSDRETGWIWAGALIGRQGGFGRVLRSGDRVDLGGCSDRETGWIWAGALIGRQGGFGREEAGIFWRAGHLGHVSKRPGSRALFRLSCSGLAPPKLKARLVPGQNRSAGDLDWARRFDPPWCVLKSWAGGVFWRSRAGAQIATPAGVAEGSLASKRGACLQPYGSQVGIL
jgi:hypothetical protein